MDRLDSVLTIIEYALNTKRKRHIIGGGLISVSLLFGGFAVTVLTIKDKEYENEEY